MTNNKQTNADKQYIAECMARDPKYKEYIEEMRSADKKLFIFIIEVLIVLGLFISGLATYIYYLNNL